MPSDLVTITVALASPIVAGVVAVVVHRQRLSHERQLADRNAAREAMKDGATRAMKINEFAALVHIHQYDADKTHRLADALRDHIDAWYAFTCGLYVLLSRHDALIGRADEVLAASGELRQALAHATSTTDADVTEAADRLGGTVGAWLEEANRRAGARI
jgi:hypothetical protein